MITGDFVNGLHLMVGTTSDLDANSKPNVATTSENTFFLVEDSGTVFYYSGGEWAQAGDDVAMIIASILGGGSELPVVDASDNGKVLGVSNGAWAVVSGGGGSADAVLYTAQTLSDLQKAQARTNIGAVGAPIVETTAETTATIDAEDNHVYECGEMSSIAISTAPSGGEFTLIFTSGATPTVLTMPVAISNNLPSGWAVEANTRYEINVRKNYPVIASWAVSA